LGTVAGIEARVVFCKYHVVRYPVRFARSSPFRLKLASLDRPSVFKTVAFMEGGRAFKFYEGLQHEIATWDFIIWQEMCRGMPVSSLKLESWE